MGLKEKMAKYPKVSVEWRTAGRDYRGCDDCKSTVLPGDPMLIITTQVSIFRGDDEVEFLCAGCGEKRGHLQPPTKAERRLSHWLQEIKAIDAKIQGHQSTINKLQRYRNELQVRINEAKGGA